MCESGAGFVYGTNRAEPRQPPNAIGGMSGSGPSGPLPLSLFNGPYAYPEHTLRARTAGFQRTNLKVTSWKGRKTRSTAARSGVTPGAAAGRSRRSTAWTECTSKPAATVPEDRSPSDS